VGLVPVGKGASLVTVGLRLVRAPVPLVRYDVVAARHRPIVCPGSMLAQSSPPQQARLHRATFLALILSKDETLRNGRRGRD